MENRISENYGAEKITRLNKLQRLIQKLLNIIKNIFANKNICIIGLDGTGKTSTVNVLVKILGDNAESQYMGSKNYITGFAQKRLTCEKENKNIISKAAYLAAGLCEMWYRVIRHWPSNKLIIYDRYAWERYLFINGIYRITGKILYKVLFPRPRYVFYLYCSPDLSLRRKNDIPDKAAYLRKKEFYDAEYLSSKHIIAIDTSENDIYSVASMILDIACKSGGKPPGKRYKGAQE